MAEKQSLFKDICKVNNINWLIDDPHFPYNMLCQIRYNGTKNEANIKIIDDSYIVKFRSPQLAITPGQSIVFYKDDIGILCCK